MAALKAPPLVLAVLLAVAVTNPAHAARRTIDYSIRGPQPFREAVKETLKDPRGWALGGAVRFRSIGRRGGRFTVTLARPARVAAFWPCTARFSCHAGGLVMINSWRWRRGAGSYRGRLGEYRRHVINHEVGHALGFGHATCSRRGAPAPVMQQQSKGLAGCRARAWPLTHEKRALGRWLGVRPRRAAPASDSADGRSSVRGVSMDALRDALRAEPPPQLSALDDGPLADLAAAIDAARARQRAELNAALDQAWGHVPRLLRGPLRRVVGG